MRAAGWRATKSLSLRCSDMAQLDYSHAISRTAAYFISLVVAIALIAVALIVETTWVLGLAALAMGLCALVFSRELSEHKPMEGTDPLPTPDSRSGRQTILTVCGALLAIGGAVLLVAGLA